MRERKINTKTHLSNGAVEAEDFIFGGILIIYKKQQGKHQTKANTKIKSVVSLVAGVVDAQRHS